jgi:hypothetical protein
MMKSWADHCSSDDESMDDYNKNEKEEEDNNDDNGAGGEQQQHSPSPPPPSDFIPIEKLYNLPDQPPFTAFIGNLAYSIKEGNDLKHAICDAVADRFGQNITMTDGRVSYARNGQHRGFGYVEVSTLDEVRIHAFLLAGWLAWLLTCHVPQFTLFGMSSPVVASLLPIVCMYSSKWS